MAAAKYGALGRELEVSLATPEGITDECRPCADRGPEVIEKIDKNKGSLKAVLGSL
jgi:hypothetical protein